MTWSFIQFSDIHLGSPESHRYQPAWVENFQNALAQVRALERRPEFLVVSGDLTRDGKTRPSELESAREVLGALEWPVHAIPGNHDVGHRYKRGKKSCICTEMQAGYCSIMGSDRFAFEHDDVRLVGFNSQLFGSGLGEEADLWEWLEQQAELSGCVKRQVWFMHAAPFCEGPDEADVSADHDAWHLIVGREAIQRIAALMRKGNVQALAYGHVHNYRDGTIDGLRFVSCPSTAFRLLPDEVWGDYERGFLEWTVDADSINCRRHLLAKISTLPGIGNDPSV